ncbi:hypothetical protein GCM10009830_21070 [Glycomyces endophyticus]|uniref:Uncharacterized protein n=1 Tax=Glycomyces endophyticus TaxID=480996 RepID=A0ABP4SLX4_9ACTN
MTESPRSTEIAAYLAAVERRLSDLPAVIRDDLMTDLDSHLAEVAADLPPGTTLVDLLGAPEAYARELRETAEVPKAPAGERLRSRFKELTAPVAARTRAAADRYAASTGHADAADLAGRLRPGWWAVRGVLVAALFVYWLSAAQYGVTGFQVLGSLPGLILLVAAVLVGMWASLRIGARSLEWGRDRRRWTAAAGLAIVALSAYQFAWFLGVPTVEYVETDYTGDAQVDDVYVYDEHGELLTGVYLLDEHGYPIQLGDPWACTNQLGEPYATADDRYGYQYPLCMVDGELPMDPTPSESPSGTPTDFPSESPTELATDPSTTPEEPATDSAAPTELPLETTTK